MKALQRAAVGCVVFCTLLAGAIVLLVWPRLFDSTPDGVGRLLASRCSAETPRPCSTKVLELSPGRYWVEADAPEASQLTLDFELAPGATARALLLPPRAEALAVAVLAGDGRTVGTTETGGGHHRRRVLLLADSDARWLRLQIGRPAGSPDRMRLSEVGVFGSAHRLLSDARPFLGSQTDRRVYYGLLGRGCLLLAALGLVAAAWLRSAPPGLLALFTLLLTLAASTLELWLVHNPYWYRAEDLRVMLASGPLQEGVGANLNYGMYLGSRLLTGEGITFGPGWVPWERMPGYAFFCAAAGLLAGYRTDLFSIGLYSLMLHLLFLALANGLFVAAACRVMRPAAALAVALVIAFMPNQLANTQADSIMVPIYLCTAAALCLYQERSRDGAIPAFRYHALVHAAFALWFLVRPDGLAGWAAVSLILYRRQWRYLALPAALSLAIGLSWAGYKHRYTGEFSMTTNTVGDNAWIGLWQVPNKFRWQTLDASYFGWAAEKGIPATSKLASDTAVREVARFALTYPLYMVHLVAHRLVEYVEVNAFNGVLSYPHVVYGRLQGWPIVALLCVFALCLALRHEARLVLLVGWPLVFSLPLFLLFFSDGMRHVAAVSASLFAATLPPLLEPGFYRLVWRRRRAAALVVLAVVAAWLGLGWLDEAVLASDRWRYWTPFLDPGPFEWYLR